MHLKDLPFKPTSKKINKITESRFGFTIDYNKLTLSKARRLSSLIEENLNKIRKSASFQTAHQNPRYMEMLMVREGLNRWLNERSQLNEDEVGQAEVILAAKNLVDSMQDMIEKVGKMQNEQLPGLLDAARDQIGSQQADTYKGTVSPVLQSLLDTLQQARETLDNAARALAGESVPQPMALNSPAPEDPVPGPESDLDSSDSFSALDAAAGGTETLGRGAR
ncbi:MAG: hypothetical protein N2235_01525 [Fischerella sp.]|nr:hypothetical protein [Fischerella sp.]